eukprot:TRINITY_DN388_c1_g1_i1.p1 TRINITY_DN388_c1_g1~~TRINITY_DN388_c1_g1_i1.p1  ORF type:complete len:449 (+),score=55.61 TRINITY_DN388_c1_g1_i1:105-1451(+)
MMGFLLCSNDGTDGCVPNRERRLARTRPGEVISSQGGMPIMAQPMMSPNMSPTLPWDDYRRQPGSAAMRAISPTLDGRQLRNKEALKKSVSTDLAGRPGVPLSESFPFTGAALAEDTMPGRGLCLSVQRGLGSHANMQSTGRASWRGPRDKEKEQQRELQAAANSETTESAAKTFSETLQQLSQSLQTISGTGVSSITIGPGSPLQTMHRGDARTGTSKSSAAAIPTAWMPANAYEASPDDALDRTFESVAKSLDPAHARAVFVRRLGGGDYEVDNCRISVSWWRLDSGAREAWVFDKGQPAEPLVGFMQRSARAAAARCPPLQAVSVNPQYGSAAYAVPPSQGSFYSRDGGSFYRGRGHPGAGSFRTDGRIEAMNMVAQPAAGRQMVHGARATSPFMTRSQAQSFVIQPQVAMSGMTPQQGYNAVPVPASSMPSRGYPMPVLVSVGN